MEISIVLDIISFFGVLFLVLDKFRASRLSCTLDGKKISVPSDEVKEAFRKAALAEASRISGGRRVNFSKIDWVGKQLVLETEKGVSNEAKEKD